MAAVFTLGMQISRCSETDIIWVGLMGNSKGVESPKK